MTSLPPSVQTPPASRTRAAKPSTGLDRTERSIWIGILCTLLFHVLLFTLAPLFPTEKFVGTHSNLKAVMARKNKSFDFQLVNPPPAPVPPANPFKFVETNPEAPANEPDKTSNFSNRNQQSAQSEAAKEKDPENRPSVKGQDEVKNDSAIVSGEHAQPQQGAAVTPSAAQTPAEQQNAQQARAEQVPLEGNEDRTGKSEDGVGTKLSHNKAATTNADQLVEGSRDSKNANGALVASPEHSSRPQPKPRPRLSSARSTILTNRISGTPNVGVLGIDARWSEYGDYMNELIEIIDASWHKIVETSSVYPKSGTHVIVTFRLNANGEVVVQSVEETAGTLGVNQCTTAITTPQPYRKWTEQMVSVLGKEQTITFGFYYY
jgi:hypothetical protein